MGGWLAPDDHQWDRQQEKAYKSQGIPGFEESLSEATRVRWQALGTARLGCQFTVGAEKKVNLWLGF